MRMKWMMIEVRPVLATAIIPYTKGLREQIRSILRGYNIRTAFGSGRSLGRILTKALLEDRTCAWSTRLKERLVKEASHIKLAPLGCRINKDEGIELSLLWLNAIRAVQKRNLRLSGIETD